MLFCFFKQTKPAVYFVVLSIKSTILLFYTCALHIRYRTYPTHIYILAVISHAAHAYIILSINKCILKILVVQQQNCFAEFEVKMNTARAFEIDAG